MVAVQTSDVTIHFTHIHSLGFLFAFSALTLLVGRQEGHPTCKKTWCWFVDDDFNAALHALRAPFVTITSIILSSNKIQNGNILVSANPGPPGKRPLKWTVIYTDCIYY